MKKVRVFAPASIANMGCGFDVIGLALDEVGDILEITQSEGDGLCIINESGVPLPEDMEKNVITPVVRNFLQRIGQKAQIEVKVCQKIYPGSGIGSSAASSAAAAYGMNELFGCPLSEEEVVECAMEGENLASGGYHADNAAPAVMGGITLIRGYDPLDIIQLPVPGNFYVAVVHPRITVETKVAREILPKAVPMHDAVHQWGNVGGLVAGLYSGNIGLVGRSMQDFVAEPYRKGFIPGFDELRSAILGTGALAMNISGSGPSVFALCDHRSVADKSGKIMQEHFDTQGIQCEVYVRESLQQGSQTYRNNAMMYYSTRDREGKRFSLKDAALMGLAPDGGLFMPETIPVADLAEVERLARISYADMACYLAGLFFGEDIPKASLEEMVRRVYDFPCVLAPLGEGSPLQVLELFHGPTFAFKDFGARFMGGMLGLLNSEGITVLTATSGDTGSAVAAGFHNVPGVDVVVLYPEGKVSPLQEAQMTTLGGNIHPVCVRGCFDDCQALVKGVFNDTSFRAGHNVTSANSINLLRWIPQSFYYFYAWAQYKASTGLDRPDVVVPSGNYGNITAGKLAARMGLPVRRFVAGANANDVVPEFLATGCYKPRASVRTLANAMDVGAPSNYERMMCLYGDDFASLSSQLEGYAYSDDRIREGIAELNALYGRESCPHSAIGYMSARDSKAEGFYLSTAHAAKFSEVLSEVLGHAPVMPDALERIQNLPRKYVTMDNSLERLEEYVSSLA